MKNAFTIGVLALAALLMLPAGLSAQEAKPASAEAEPLDTTGAHQVIEGFHADLLDILRQSEELGQAGRAEALHPILNRSMNLRALGIGAVGRRNWSTWDDDQRDQFLDVFTRFMASTYAARFKSFNNQEFLIIRERPGPRSSIIVMTQVKSPARDTTNIDYLMIYQNDQWAVADIFLDSAVSEVAMRRSEFSGILRKDGFDALLVAIRDKTTRQNTP